VQVELVPGDGLEDLLEGADAAGQGNKGPAPLVHDALALVHGRDMDHLAVLDDARVGPLGVDHGERDDAGDVPAGLQRPVGDGPHHACSAPAVDEPEPALAEQSPERSGRVHVGDVVPGP